MMAEETEEDTLRDIKKMEFKELSDQLDIRVRDGEEESMHRFLAYATGRVVGPFCETQTTGRRAGSKVWL